MTAKRGVFIVFEGGDGAGKSTQIELLAAYVRSTGRDAVVTHEPGGSRIGKQVRSILLDGDDLDLRAEALLFAADRADHVSAVIRPALLEGAVVISDRFADSSIAYQGAGRGLGTDEVAALARFATQGLVPDLTVVLDIEPAAGRARVAELGAADRIERASDDLHARVRRMYLDLAAVEPDRYLVLDAEQPVDVLAQRIRTEVGGAL